MRSRLQWLVLILPVLWALAFFDFAIFTGGDNAYYLILAESITHHQEYADLSLPGNPPATHFPPLLPLLLSPLIAVFGHDYVPGKFLTFFLFGLSIVLCHSLFRKIPEVSRKESVIPDAAVLVLAYAFNLTAVEHSHYVLSEIPYIAFSLVSILFFTLYLENRRPHAFFVAIVAAMLTFHLRTIGFTLVLAELVVVLRRDKKIFAAGLAIAILTAIPWTLRNRIVSGSTSNYLKIFLLRNVYAEDLGTVTLQDVLQRLSTNGKQFALQVQGELLTSKNGGPFVSIPLLLLTLVGFVEGLRKPRSQVIIWYLIIYNVFLLSWHWYDTRYALPVLPFFLYSLYLGTRRVLLLARRRASISVILLLLLILPNLHSGSIQLPSRWRGNSEWLSGNKLYPYPKHFGNYFSVAQIAKAGTQEDAIFCARKPSLFYWFSGRKCMVYPYSSKPGEIRDFLEQSKIRYVVLDTFFSTTRAYLLPAIMQMRDELLLVYETPTFPKVYLLEVPQQVTD